MNNGNGAVCSVSCTFNVECNDGSDNDGDGFIDFPADVGCTSVNDDNETNDGAFQCNDGIDNDGDGFIDFPEDPGCDNPTDDDERDSVPPECSDGLDNDGDGLIDYPNDPDCIGPADRDESGSEGKYEKPNDNSRNNIMFNRIRTNGFVYDDAVKHGAEQLVVNLNLGNIGELDFDRTTVRATIFGPEGAYETGVNVFNEWDADSIYRVDVAVDVPEDIEPGIYDVRITVETDEGIRRVRHREFRVTEA